MSNKDVLECIHIRAGFLNKEGFADEWAQVGVKAFADLVGLPNENNQFESSIGGRRPIDHTINVATQRANAAEFASCRDDQMVEYNSAADGILQEHYSVKAEDTGIITPVVVSTPRSLIESGGTKPLGVHFHGGGWVTGSAAQDDLFCRMMVRDADCVVVNVDYRLAPEHPWPAAVEDALSVVKWVFANHELLRADSSMIFVTGNSAGGQLSASVALELAATGYGHKLKAQLLRIPVCCHPRFLTEKGPERENLPIMTDTSLLSRMNSYAPDTDSWRSYLLSPLLASDEVIGKLPPSYIDVCSMDPCATGGKAYANKLAANGVPTRLAILEGMPHGSYVLYPGLSSSREAHREFINGVKWALGQ